MNQKDNILQELNELNSNLVTVGMKEVYVVPADYFETLPELVLNRIKALDAGNAADELSILSPVLSKISREIPFRVPAGYFQTLENSLLHAIQSNDQLRSVDEEITAISPLLGSIKKEMPYSVPQGYFENTGDLIPEEAASTPAKVVSLTHRKWFRYAAAAVVTGIIILSGFLIFNNNQSAEPGSKALAKFTKDVKKMDDTQKDELIDYIDAGLSGDESAQINPSNQKEIKELLKGISEKELINFNQQSEDLENVLAIN